MIDFAYYDHRFMTTEHRTIEIRLGLRTNGVNALCTLYI